MKFKEISSEYNIKYFLWTCLKRSVHSYVRTWNFAQEEAKKTLLTGKERKGYCLSLYNQSCGRTADVTMIHYVHCAKGKKIEKQFTYHLFSFITGIKTKMLLFVFLGLIANLAFLSGECDVGTLKLKDFDWNKVGVRVKWFMINYL